LWGDTVAIAKKLASGTGAAIRVTDAVHQRMGEQFQFNGPMRVESHGKAPIDAWEVTG
jgi:class 3 adenylate cyclase